MTDSIAGVDISGIIQWTSRLLITKFFQLEKKNTVEMIQRIQRDFASCIGQIF